jgi:four helix bundle protein
MTTVQKFEDLICWQKSRLLTKEIYRVLKNCKDFGFKDQIQRAAVSIMSNIAEGFERGTQQELVNYLYIAKGSAGEVRAQLYVALDVGYLNIEMFKYLNNLVQECSRLIQSFAQKVKGGSKQGSQFKRVQKEDPMKELLKTTAPEMYERFYGEK